MFVQVRVQLRGGRGVSVAVVTASDSSLCFSGLAPQFLNLPFPATYLSGAEPGRQEPAGLLQDPKCKALLRRPSLLGASSVSSLSQASSQALAVSGFLRASGQSLNLSQAGGGSGTNIRVHGSWRSGQAPGGLRAVAFLRNGWWWELPQEGHRSGAALACIARRDCESGQPDRESAAARKQKQTGPVSRERRHEPHPDLHSLLPARPSLAQVLCLP